MFAEERIDKIIEILKLEGKVTVKGLSEKFNVSEGMIRKDLAKIEGIESIKRTYGGAILERKIVKDGRLITRVISNIEEKEDISDIAINNIEDNDVIFLDISTTNNMIANKLINSKKKLTIITNMNRIVMEFDNVKNIDVIQIGGSYNKILGGTVGSSSIEEIKKIKVDKAFIGVGGMNVFENFISNFDLDEALTKKEIIKSSKKTYILAENEKFYKDACYKFSGLEDIDYIITNKKPNEDIIKKIKEYDLELLYKN